MLNFTGQTNKRVVNLGNRRSNTSSNSRNYLEQTRIQRQKREEQRQREKAGLVLQSYIRRYLDLNDEAQRIQEEWKRDSNDQVVDWSIWITKFEFISKWAFPSQPINRTRETLISLDNCLNEFVNNSIDSRLFDKLLETLIRCIKIFNAKKSSVDMIVLVSRIIKTLINIASSAISPNAYRELILNLTFTCNEVGETITDDDLSSMVDLIYEVNVKDSYQNFIKFLAIPSERIVLSKNHHRLDILRSVFVEYNDTLNNLSDHEKAYLLVRVLRIHGSDDKFIEQDYFMIGRILSTISFSIYSQDQNPNDDENDDVEDKLDGKIDKVYLDSESYTALQILYSSVYIKQGIQIFTNNTHTSLSNLVLYSFATLIYLIPSLKSKLCMLVTITPGSYTWFFNELKNDPIYKFLENTSENDDYAKVDDLKKIYCKLQHENSIDRFWKTLFTFEEFYSYWLIVSNDLESFADDKLVLKDVSEFLTFLKTLCLTLIFNNMNSQKDYFKDYNKLKDISISLLNQLYMKNLRLNFLPADFWILKNLNFNIDSMIQIIATEEEKRISLENLSSDENIEDNDDMTLNINAPVFSSSFKPKKPKFLNSSHDTLAKLEVLKKLPFFLSFKDRVRIFQTLIDLDRQRTQSNDNIFNAFITPKLLANIRREFLLEDAFENFHKLGSQFKNKLSVTFFNEYGGQEAGIDGGGITKEFLTSVVLEAFKPSNKFGLFKETPSDYQLYPNDDIYKKLYKKIDVDIQREKLFYLKFLGSIIGKCFYENVLVDISFAPFFLNKWCNVNNSMKNSINDLNYLDNELFKNLMKLLSMTSDELKELDLNFTIEEKIDGLDYKFDLLPPNGETTLVNTSNELNYIHQVSNFKLNQSLHIQSKFFLDGLFEIINANWLSMFDSFELQMLISGGENDINIQDWKENVEYGGFFDDDITIINFWQVVSEMSPQERFKLIKFVTSVSRAPLLGFGALSPKFGIRNSGRSIERLPTASTCVNLLKLPDYQDKELIRTKLLYAINTDSRFDLS